MLQCNVLDSEGFANRPPKRLKWTVIFVATDGSANPVISCAAKMFRGLCLQPVR